jgi:pyruvate kinase
VAIGADFLAISFPRSAADIHLARQLLIQAGGHAHIVAKIERAEAIDMLDEIIEASDVVMVARGDLGVEVGDALVPSLQKRIIKLARAKNKVTITATQMLESMINNVIPTRAEVSDVANAVLDGTDAVMLSAETASGQYPLEAIAAMDRVCIEAENEQALQMMPTADVRRFTKIDESIAMAASYVAEHLPIKAVVALSQSGASVLWLSRSNIIAPIYALSPYSETRQRLKLYRGVHNFALAQESIDTRESWVIAEETLLQKGILIEGDLILMMTCEHTGKAVNTNTLRAMVVGKT